MMMAPPKIINVKRITFLLFIIIVAALFRFNELDSPEIMWDELMDLGTTLSYLKNPNPFDISDDGANIRFMQISQARLPFYIAAFSAYFVSKNVVPDNPNSANLDSYLHFARLPSVLFGIITVLMVYFLAKGFYGGPTGSLSALLLAISSYHIGFSRFAVTHGGSYDPFFYLLSLLLFFKGMAGRSQKYLLFAGMTAGIACACKFSAVLLLPTFFLLMFSDMAAGFRKPVTEQRLSLKIKHRDKHLPRLLQLNLLVLFSFVLIAVFPFMLISSHSHNQQFAGELAGRILFFFLAVAGGYLVMLFTIILKMKNQFEKNALALIFINILLTSIVFTFIGSPIHLNLRSIGTILAWIPQFLQGGYTGYTEWFGRLPLNIIFFKLGLPFNLLFFLGLGYNLFHLKDKANLFISVSFLLYFIVVSGLKDFTSWYLMPILPLAIIMGSRFIVLCWETAKVRLVRVILAVSIFAGVGVQLWTLAKIAPHYHLDGYKLGAQFIGYNKPCFLFVDGIRNSAGWIERNIPDYSRVGIVYYIPHTEAARFDIVFQTLSSIYRGNKTINYEYVNNQEELCRYDYLIVSSIFGKEWVDKSSPYDLVYAVNLSGLEVFRIYKKQS